MMSTGGGGNRVLQRNAKSTKSTSFDVNGDHNGTTSSIHLISDQITAFEVSQLGILARILAKQIRPLPPSMREVELCFRAAALLLLDCGRSPGYTVDLGKVPVLDVIMSAYVARGEDAGKEEDGGGGSGGGGGGGGVAGGVKAEGGDETKRGPGTVGEGAKGGTMTEASRRVATNSGGELLLRSDEENQTEVSVQIHDVDVKAIEMSDLGSGRVGERATSSSSSSASAVSWLRRGGPSTSPTEKSFVAGVSKEGQQPEQPEQPEQQPQIKRTNSILQHVAKHLRSDPEVVLEAVRRDCDELLHASEELKGDKAFVLSAIDACGGAAGLVDESVGRVVATREEEEAHV